MIKLLVVVSDIHCGSDVGLATPETETKAGNVIGFGKNYHQRWLWESWTSGIKSIKTVIGRDHESAALLVNGDATEGSHHRNDADLIASDILTHTNMAIDCLTPLRNLVDKAFVTLGTECHTKEMEHLLAEKLRAETGKAKNQWLIDCNKGCLVDAKHHMGVTSRAYLEASAMSIEMANVRVNCIRAGHRVPTVFLRGHRHCGGYFTDGSGLFGVTGGFQFLTRHGHKVVPSSIPSPTILVLDWRKSAPGALPYVHQFKFNPPQEKIYS